jgi:prepilin-type N-terminal cleavage/methylation domain-containing protein
MRRGHGDDGVTLVELLVSMTIMGIVIALAGPTLLSAMNATNRLQLTSAAVDDAQFVSARLDRELRSAICVSLPPVNTAGGNVLEFVTLDGGAQSTVTYTVAGGEISRSQNLGPAFVLATMVGPSTTVFKQIATPLRTIEVKLPVTSRNGGSFLLETTIAGRNAWRSC